MVKSVHGTDRWTQDDDVNAPVQEDGGHRWPLPEQFKSIRQKADCYGSRNSQGRRKMKLSVGHLVPRPVEVPKPGLHAGKMKTAGPKDVTSRAKF